MSNIAPQRPKLNQGIWLSAEKQIAKLAQDDRGPGAKDDIKNLWVISGPIFEGPLKRIGGTGVAIPDAFFKIVVRKTGYRNKTAQAIGLLYPHEPADAERERFVSVDLIEQMTGFDSHPNLEDRIEDRVEGEIRDWGGESDRWQANPAVVVAEKIPEEYSCLN